MVVFIQCSHLHVPNLMRILPGQGTLWVYCTSLQVAYLAHKIVSLSIITEKQIILLEATINGSYPSIVLLSTRLH